MNLRESRIAILIVTHNHQDYVKDLIDSCKKIPEIHKYICDAASTDNTLVTLRSEIGSRSDFHILAKEKLEGFSKNNNDLVRNFRLLDCDFLLINPDCYFSEDSFREFITKAASIDNLGVAAPQIHYPDGRAQVTWRKYPSIYSFFYRRFINSLDSPINQYASSSGNGIFNIEWALGAFLYVSNNFLRSNNFNLFDERYRLYCEDADLCLSAYHHELKVVGIPNNGIYHALQEKSRKKLSKFNYWNFTSGIKFMCKWNFRYFLLIRYIRSK